MYLSNFGAGRGVPLPTMATVVTPPVYSRTEEEEDEDVPDISNRITTDADNVCVATFTQNLPVSCEVDAVGAKVAVGGVAVTPKEREIAVPLAQ